MISSVLFATVLSAPQALPAAPYSGFKGVNVAGGDFSHGIYPGVLNKNYFFDTDPTLPTMKSYAASGSNAYRIPFLWERMQPVLGGDLDPTHLAQYKAAIAALPSTAKIIVDCHNYAQYKGKHIGVANSTVTNAQFADFWVKFGTALKTCTTCIFGLANEPTFAPDPLTEDEYGTSWAATNAVVVKAMRAALIKQTIAISGTGYSNRLLYANSQAATEAVMVGMTNVILEFHPYYDELPHPGLNIAEACPSGPAQIETMKNLTLTLRTKKLQAFIGEFATNRVKTCIESAQAIADLVKANADVWIGIIAWGGGAHYANLSMDGITLLPDTTAGPSPMLAKILPSL